MISIRLIFVDQLPSVTIVFRFWPSSSARSMEPSFLMGLPILVQYMCPASTSTTTPSGIRHPVTMIFRSEPSGFADRTLPELTSRKNKRPTVDLLLRGGRICFGRCGVHDFHYVSYMFSFDVGQNLTFLFVFVIFIPILQAKGLVGHLPIQAL